MKLKMKLLDLTLIGLLSAGVVLPVAAQTPEGTRAAPSVAPALQRAGRYAASLPGGGAVWATEDPTLAAPRLSVMAGGLVPFEGGRIAKPVHFQGYTNYPAFIDRLEVRIYRDSDVDLVTPLATIPLSAGAMPEADWDGVLPADVVARAGDSLRYVTRAYARDGSFDETFPQLMQLVTHDIQLLIVKMFKQRAQAFHMRGENLFKKSLASWCQLCNPTAAIFGAGMAIQQSLAF